MGNESPLLRSLNPCRPPAPGSKVREVRGNQQQRHAMQQHGGRSSGLTEGVFCCFSGQILDQDLLVLPDRATAAGWGVGGRKAQRSAAGGGSIAPAARMPRFPMWQHWRRRQGARRRPQAYTAPARVAGGLLLERIEFTIPLALCSARRDRRTARRQAAAAEQWRWCTRSAVRRAGIGAQAGGPLRTVLDFRDVRVVEVLLALHDDEVQGHRRPSPGSPATKKPKERSNRVRGCHVHVSSWERLESSPCSR